MSFWTPQHFQEVTGGRWLKTPVDVNAPLAGVNTDTRTLAPDQVFIALTGERYDGHDYLTAAAHAGASILLISQEDKIPQDIAGASVLLVDDTLKVLQTLAADYRQALAKAGVKVIAVGGSNGKTTTRHLIHSVLLATLKGTQSPKSFNNHIGVPLTLLAASEEDDFVVVEVGTNHPGEIDFLGKIVQPDAAVLTSIGQEHLAYFKNLQGVAQEEASLLRYVQPEGLILLPGEPSQKKYLEPFLQLVPAQANLHWFGSQSETGQNARDLQFNDQGSSFTDAAGLTIKLPLLGRHNVDNALAAIAAARWMGIADSDIAQSLKQARGVSMRMEITQIGDQADKQAGDQESDQKNNPPRTLTLINDAYNANPDSMRAALEALMRLQPKSQGRRIAILGDMLELGDLSPQTHRELGQFAVELDAKASTNKKPALSLVILIGKMAMFAAGEMGRSWPDNRFMVIPAWDDQVPARVASMLKPGDVVLIKASRGMALERLVPAIELHMNHPESPADHTDKPGKTDQP